jgi:hypothetical protein
MVTTESEMITPAREPVLGEIVRYYLNGWRYGKLETVHPRAKTADILPLGAVRKARKGSKRAEAGLPRTFTVPLSEVYALAMAITLEPGECIDTCH